MIDHLFGDDQLRIGLPSGHDSVGSLICPPRGSKNPSYQRIFATLLLVGNDMFKEIGNFIAEGINDTKLPLNLVYSLDNEPKALARSSMDETPLAFSRHHWRTRHLKDFVRCQWQVSPMFITSKRGEITHYKCREGEILPFMPVGPKQRLLFWGDNITPDPGVTNYGGNSVMFKCQIHESQQNLRRYTTNKSGRAIAVKKLQSTVLEDFINERRMLVRLTPNTTQHLSKLLATFETPYTSGNTPYHNYYLMFEWADMSLLDLWKRGHPTIIEQCTLSQWVAQQCQGLAKALDIIHEFKTHKSKSDPETRTHGFHGDIKPENILWYSNWEGCGHPFGVLQITDFGLSSFHNTTTAIDIKARMLDHVYSPPESKLARRISQSLDIWTLGCLFLDFAAWLADGMRGFDNFEGARMKEQFVKGWKEAAFYAVEEKIPGQTTVAINEKVIEWMQNLCGSLDRCSQFICDFVQVILDQMLVVENGEDAVDNGQSEDVDSAYDGSPDSEPSMSMSKRITAGQLALQLLKIVEKGETQEDYHVRGGQRIPNLRLHHDKRLQIVINESRKSVGEGIRKKRKHVETPSTAPAGGSSHLLAV
ncbi:kinase-like domain-containing protein [Camillea tinctor]|nr:kinase-like domain-containing protein [Camillea tinctor]